MEFAKLLNFVVYKPKGNSKKFHVSPPPWFFLIVVIVLRTYLSGYVRMSKYGGQTKLGIVILL